VRRPDGAAPHSVGPAGFDWTFNAFKLKGIVRGMGAESSSAHPLPGKGAIRHPGPDDVCGMTGRPVPGADTDVAGQTKASCQEVIRIGCRTGWEGVALVGTCVVSGALANKYGNGGGAWERLSWATGLRRLGLDVHFVEQIAPGACVDASGAVTSFADSINLAWFRSVTRWFGLADRSTLVCDGGEQCAGLPWRRLLEVAASAELLVNLSGHLTLAPVLDRVRRKAYVDVDPGFTQFWHAAGNPGPRLAGHDFYFTIGENIGTPDCPVPTGGIPWRPTRQPVVLEQWPVGQTGMSAPRFTTVASWRGPYGPVTFGGRTYGLKVHEFRKLLELPRRCRQSFEVALDIHPADEKDLTALRANGWRVVDPRAVAGDPAAFHRYVQGSSAEFSVAQGIYVDTNSGWFSDRTVRYLASGKPALVQDTGFGRNLPVGEGLLAFQALDEAADGAERIARDYDRHCRAARAIAEEHFDSGKVLGRLLREVGVSP